MKKIKLYGIPNCDTCRKALKMLQNNDTDFEFHDLKQSGIDKTTLLRWLKQLDYTDLLNRRSKTWRTLDSAEREKLDQQTAIELIIKFPLLLKRPVIETQHGVTAGLNNSTMSTHKL